MEDLLKPYIFYPITVIVAVIYYVFKAPEEWLADWWKSLAFGLLLIFAFSTIGSMAGYGAPELLTFRAVISRTTLRVSGETTWEKLRWRASSRV